MKRDESRIWPKIMVNVTPHHFVRYEFANKFIPLGKKCADVACGVGYGSFWLHQWGKEVHAVDIDESALAHAKKYFPGPTYYNMNAVDLMKLGRFDAVISFETIEHLPDPSKFLIDCDANYLIASVPNELFVPFNAEHFKNDKYPHYRHYTPDEFSNFFESRGYSVVGKYCQKSKSDYKISNGTEGNYLVYIGHKKSI